MEELINWLRQNKIEHTVIDEETIEIDGMGKMLYDSLEGVDSIFKTTPEGEQIFNGIAESKELLEEGISCIVFKFGNNWYFTDLRKGFKLNILKYVGRRTLPNRQEEFVNLGVHTPYELLNGSFMPKEWVKKAQYLGHKALGVCDQNTMASLFSFQKECDAAGVTPVFGYSLTVRYGDNVFGGKVFVQSQQGLRNLLRIQKAIMVDSPENMIEVEELLSLSEGNVFVFDKYSTPMLTSGLNGLIEAFKSKFEHVFYQVDLAEYKAERIDARALECVCDYFHNPELMAAIEPILLSDCYYLDKDDAKNKIILNKIATGAAHEQSDDQYFKDIDEHYAAFEQLFDESKWDIQEIFAKCCKGTVLIAEGAKARFETSRNFMPQYDMTSEEKAKYGTPLNMFHQLLEEGLKRLVPLEDHARYRKQMEYETYIIESTNNVDYLLVQYDTVNYCKKNGILVGCGRGSAAGSLLLYLLGITLVDPMKYDLIFERFLLPERAGLYSAKTTMLGQRMTATKYIEVELECGKTLFLDADAELLIKADDDLAPIHIYADQLQDGDDILFDNRDSLYIQKEL